MFARPTPALKSSKVPDSQLLSAPSQAIALAKKHQYQS